MQLKISIVTSNQLVKEHQQADSIPIGWWTI